MLQKLHTLGRLRLAVVTAIALLAVVLVGGTLFAANDQRPRNAGDTTDPTGPVLDRVSLQADDIQKPIDLPPIDKEPLTYPNLDSTLNGLVESSAGIHQPTDRANRTTGQSAETVLVTFYIELDQVDAVRQYLEANEIFVRHVGADYIEAHVPPSMLGVASEQPGVIRVETVIPPRRLQAQTRVTSQGVGLHGADVWHNAGYQGDGVKVGIIDDGFEGFSQLQGSELPEDVMARCYFEGPQRPSSDFADCIEEGTHGTVVAETLVDVAPDVELYITNAYSPGDLRDAVEWMAEQGVEVINVSLGWPYDGPGDGTSRDSDSPLNTIDFAVSQGITWVNAAGNSAGRVWYGRFSDPERDGVHNFEPDDVGNALFLPEGSQPTFAMRWDDDWGRADCDLDLELYRNVRGPDGRYIRVGADLTEQDGTPGSEPFAGLVVDKPVTTAQAGVYFLVIRKWVCANDPGWIQLLVYDTSILQYASSGHHMGNPEESRSAGMLAVGATHYWDTAHIAAYSSRGPTIDGRTKPDITGVACGATATNEPFSIGDHQCWFSGTSQSSPHVAGLAALVKQRFPDYGPVETVRYLQENALDRGALGADNTWGNGFAILPNPSVSLAPTKVGTIADMMLTVDQMSTIDVSTYFIDHDGDMLTYTAGSSDAMIATATVSGSMLTIEGKMEGTATITVNATDLAGSGMSATQTFDVTVTAEFVAPVITTTNPVGSGIVLVSWDSVAGAAGYALIASNLTNPSGETRTAAAGRDATAGQIQGLTVGDEYLIFVGAFNTQLEFELSAFVRVTAE